MADLEQRLEDPKLDPLTHRQVSEAAGLIRWFLSEEVQALRDEADRSAIKAWCEGLPDPDLSRLVGESDGVQRLSLLMSYAQLDGDRVQKDVIYRAAISLMLADEFCRRQGQNENAPGRDVRLFLVEEGERVERLDKLADRAAKGLWLPGDQVEGEKDAKSEAQLALLEETRPYLDVEPVANDPDAMLAIMQGRFNDTIERVRRRVRTQIETELRRLKTIHHVEVGQACQDGSGSGLLVEHLPVKPDPSEQAADKLLVEELLASPSLDADDRKLLRLHFLEDKTQQEMCAEMDLSQSALSKRLKRALRKLQQVLVSQRLRHTDG